MLIDSRVLFFSLHYSCDDHATSAAFAAQLLEGIAAESRLPAPPSATHPPGPIARSTPCLQPRVNSAKNNPQKYANKSHALCSAGLGFIPAQCVLFRVLAVAQKKRLTTTTAPSLALLYITSLHLFTHSSIHPSSSQASSPPPWDFHLSN